MQSFTGMGWQHWKRDEWRNSCLQYTAHSLSYSGMSCRAMQMTGLRLKSCQDSSMAAAQATRHIGGGESSVEEGWRRDRLCRRAVMSIESGWCGLLCLAAAAAPAKYFGPTRPADSRSRPDQQPTRHQSAVALRPVTDAGRRRAAPACARDSQERHRQISV